MIDQQLIHRRSGVAAFTLVELLVVIGIITVLLGILIPVVGRARESANRTACLSNLRQLVAAMTAYTQRSDGIFPKAGVIGEPEDWVYWQPGRDRDKGRLVPYLGGHFNAKNYICPSDRVSEHGLVDGSPYPYPFSYTVNLSMCGYGLNDLSIHIDTIRRPSEKILLVDEASTTIDDACWAPMHYSPAEHRNLLSAKHEMGAEKRDDLNFGRGCVGFVDGHADWVARNWAMDPMHYDAKLP